MRSQRTDLDNPAHPDLLCSGHLVARAGRMTGHPAGISCSGLAR